VIGSHSGYSYKRPGYFKLEKMATQNHAFRKPRMGRKNKRTLPAYFLTGKKKCSSLLPGRWEEGKDKRTLPAYFLTGKKERKDKRTLPAYLLTGEKSMRH
jgi:hypothetical protein